MENKRLSYEEALALYNNYVIAKDSTKKSELKKELILGTMDYIKEAIMHKKIVAALVSMGYDQDEILNSAYEIWIELLDAGVLNDIDGFDYNHSSFNSLIKIIENQLDEKLDYSFVRNFNGNYKHVVDMIGEYRKYIKDHERNDEVLMEIIEKNLLKNYKDYRWIRENTIYFCKYINTFIDNSNDLILYLPLTQMKTHFNYLKSLGFTREISQFTPDSKDEYGDLINKITYSETIRDAINNCKLTSMEREIIELQFGLTGDTRKSFGDLAKKYNTKAGIIAQKYRKALRKLRYYIESKKNIDADELLDDQYIKW